jgi:predicted metal-dependent peptidase
MGGMVTACNTRRRRQSSLRDSIRLAVHPPPLKWRAKIRRPSGTLTGQLTRAGRRQNRRSVYDATVKHNDLLPGEGCATILLSLHRSTQGYGSCLIEFSWLFG